MPYAHLKTRLVRALKSGAVIDFTTRNLSRALLVNERRVRRVLKAMQTEGVVAQELREKDGKRSVPALWSAA